MGLFMFLNWIPTHFWNFEIRYTSPPPIGGNCYICAPCDAEAVHDRLQKGTHYKCEICRKPAQMGKNWVTCILRENVHSWSSVKIKFPNKLPIIGQGCHGSGKATLVRKIRENHQNSGKSQENPTTFF